MYTVNKVLGARLKEWKPMKQDEIGFFPFKVIRIDCNRLLKFSKLHESVVKDGHRNCVKFGVVN
jgi:hypothetical protein